MAFPSLASLSVYNTTTQIGVHKFPPLEEPRRITPGRGKLGPDVPHDGDCLYHCLAELYNATPTFRGNKTGLEVMKELKQHIDQNWDRLAATDVGNVRDKTHYLQTFHGRWGGNMEIEAASEVYLVNIFLWVGHPVIDEDGPDEIAVEHALLSDKFFPIDGSKNELKEFPRWDLFLHKRHFRYLRPPVSDFIRTLAHTDPPPPPPERPPRSPDRPRRPPERPPRSPNQLMRELTAEREARARAAVEPPSCPREPVVDLDYEATLRLVQQLEATERDEARDHELALRMSRM